MRIHLRAWPEKACWLPKTCGRGETAFCPCGARRGNLSSVRSLSHSSLIGRTKVGGCDREQDKTRSYRSSRVRLSGGGTGAAQPSQQPTERGFERKFGAAFGRH